MKESLEKKILTKKFYHDKENVFERSIQQQNEITKPKTTGNEDLDEAILRGVEIYSQITQRNNEISSNSIQSNARDRCIITTLPTLMNSFEKSQFSLTDPKGNRFSMTKTYSTKCYKKRINFSI